jgi:pyruvate-formate lyase-activating enzyme
MVGRLILTLTRACTLRCSYCPTAKEGWPALTCDDALRALELFDARYGGGEVKLFGGEPLLAPEVVRAVMDDAQARPSVRQVLLSTNGLALDGEWLDYLANRSKAVLAISLDGRSEDHRRHRRAVAPATDGGDQAQGSDAYDHLMGLMPKLLATPRVVVNQTIAPDAAEAVEQNFAHLLSLGLTRFNFLPGYYLSWRSEQIAALRVGLDGIARVVKSRWARGAPLHVRNLFAWAPTPLFNSGLCVDSDGTIHGSNVGMASPFEELLAATRLGSLDDPPSLAALTAQGETMTSKIAQLLPPGIWESTLAVDRELTRFCRGLYGDFAAYRRRRREVA